ncbi:hypothetical protein BDB01DRAFT_309221 [Pilobolus umbonatus]|nr:hypothetical protein BDB01DRAFT_309221 [Pilobolus umbonatus]
MIAYGGVDALIWLCKSSKNISLHHIATTILSILTEKGEDRSSGVLISILNVYNIESIRPVIITKWALPPILYLIHNYTQPDSKEDEKQSPTTSIKSGTTTLSHQSSLDNTVEGKQNIILEITINCTHILYQLSRAGILSQKEVISDGILNTLLKLAVFNVSPAANDKRSMDTNEEQQCQHMIERLNIINSLAIKSISAICSLGSFQDSIIKIIQSTNTMPSLLRSSNSEVQKYMAKSFAYLSLRNEKYKAHLVKGEGARALISIIAVLPHQDPENETEDARLEELSYYFSKCIKLDSNEYKKEGSECLNSATVSHACCALANLATNNESQMCLMSQPHFLRHLCNVPAVFSNAEIHRHVARCLANLTLYENNIDKMLADKEKDDIHSFNVLPTLLAMGQSARVTSDIQRQLVRAIDNLSSHVFKSVEDEVGYRVGLFEETFLYIQRILDDESDKDADTVKRARNIMEREVTVVVEKVDEQSPKTKRNKKKSKGKTKGKKG